MFKNAWFSAVFVCGLMILVPNALAEEPVSIGVLADMAGTSSDIGGIGSVVAVELAVADFGGKVGGREIVVVSADHQAKPEVGAAIAGRWYDVDKVDVIVDLPVSSVALAVQRVAHERKKVVMVTAGTSAVITGKSCSPYTVHWADDTNALAEGTSRAVVQSGGTTWFFITADFIFGISMEQAASKVITAAGGEVLGTIKAPLNTADYSSFVLQAQASGSKIVGLAVVGTDFINAVRQASEFGIVAAGQKLVGFLNYISDIHSLGLEVSQGLQITESFYWDTNDETREFAKKFMERRKVMPTKVHAQNYAAVTHYLNAVEATGTTDADKTMAWMKENPADYFGQSAQIREDGRVLFDLRLYEVKAPDEEKYPWDYYSEIGVLPADQAFRPMDREACTYLNAVAN